jgi:hypothetical protein
MATMAATGVVLAHGLAYLAAFPDAHRRAAVLGATGHGYLAALVPLLAGAGLLAVTWIVADPVRRRLQAVDPNLSIGRRAPSVSRLVAVQIGVFVAVEYAERAIAGVSTASLWHRPEFALGLALQVAVALAAYALLRGAERLACRLVAMLRPRPNSSTSTRPSIELSLVPRTSHRRPGGPRAPPLVTAL